MAKLAIKYTNWQQWTAVSNTLSSFELPFKFLIMPMNQTSKVQKWKPINSNIPNGIRMRLYIGDA